MPQWVPGSASHTLLQPSGQALPLFPGAGLSQDPGEATQEPHYAFLEPEWLALTQQHHGAAAGSAGSAGETSLEGTPEVRASGSGTVALSLQAL
jgi:hypothetical protein